MLSDETLRSLCVTKTVLVDESVDLSIDGKDGILITWCSVLLDCGNAVSEVPFGLFIAWFLYAKLNNVLLLTFRHFKLLRRFFSELEINVLMNCLYMVL